MIQALCFMGMIVAVCNGSLTWVAFCGLMMIYLAIKQLGG